MREMIDSLKVYLGSFFCFFLLCFIVIFIVGLFFLTLSMAIFVSQYID